MAMYDFNAAQWHFVRIDISYPDPDNKEA